jgi:serine/threonine protein kinase
MAIEVEAPKFTGTSVPLPGLGRVRLTELVHQNSETAIYNSTRPGMVVKTFDLDCGKADEMSYGPFLSYRVELENWKDLQGIDELRARVPAFYGADVDYDRKLGFIAMEFLIGQDLLSWCQEAANLGYPEAWAREFRSALFETLDIVQRFHKHGIVLIDFKPDNVIRLSNGAIKFVDLGAFFTPRHNAELENYVYAATPDYAELVIDTSAVQTGQAIKPGADIFSCGVAMFEMATGDSRLGMAADCAEQMLKLPEVYLFRDSQIRDIWKAYPHLKTLLPSLQTQLRERRILFAEFWHLLKGYLGTQVAGWETMEEEAKWQMLLDTGRNFISDQLPDALKWLAEPIARATTLRSHRLTHIRDLVNYLAEPVAEEIRAEVLAKNLVVQMAHDLEPPVEFRETFNTWELRFDTVTNCWAMSTRRLANTEFRHIAPFTFLKQISADTEGHRFYEVVGDLEADFYLEERLTLDRLASDPMAWLG